MEQLNNGVQGNNILQVHKNDSLNSRNLSASPVKKIKAILKKSPNAPKRFKSAYICFVTEKMDEVRSSLSSDMKVFF